jgi:dihydrolipoamide dehydrogenase
MQGRTAVFHALGDIVIPLEKLDHREHLHRAGDRDDRLQREGHRGRRRGRHRYKLPLAANPRAKMGIRDGFVKIIARKGSARSSAA